MNSWLTYWVPTEYAPAYIGFALRHQFIFWVISLLFFGLIPTVLGIFFVFILSDFVFYNALIKKLNNDTD